MLQYVLFGLVAALIIAVIIFGAIRNNKIRKNGIEADAVLSRIEEDERIDSEGGIDTTYTYYVTYQAQDGQTVEAKLNHAPWSAQIGDRIRIKYLPEKPKFALLIK